MTTETLDPTETPTDAETATPETDTRANEDGPHLKTFGDIAEERMARLMALRENVIQAVGRYEQAKAYAKAAKDEAEEERVAFEKEFDDVVRLMKGDVDLPLFQSLNAPAVPRAIADLVALLQSVNYAVDPIVAASFTLDDQAQIRTWAKVEAERLQLVAEGRADEAAALSVPPMPKILRREETEPPAGEVATGTFAEAGPFASDRAAAPVEVHGEDAPDAQTLYDDICEDIVLRDPGLTRADVEAWAPEDRVRVARWIRGGPNAAEPPAVIARFLAPLDDDDVDEDANDAEPDPDEVERESEDAI